MKKVKLVLPNPKYKDNIMNYKREFIDNGENIYGSAGLKYAESFEQWYNKVLDNSKEETVREGLVLATPYLALNDENILVGMINIRHKLNESLLNMGGHIGYSVRKSERKQGYATEMLGLALKECLKIGINKVLITCDKDNIASAKTIIKNGGKLENEIAEEDKIIQRYWITLF